jgi:hypothetical protein
MLRTPIVGDIVVAGSLITPGGQQGIPGEKGDIGDTGPQGIIEEAPIDTKCYGRKDAAWNRVVAISGDTMTGGLVATGFFAKGGGWCGVSNQINPGWYLASGNDYRYDAITIYKLDGSDILKTRYHNASGVLVFDANLLDSYHKVTGANLASGAAVANIGYTPVNRAGDTITGSLTVSSSLTVNSNIQIWGTLNVQGGGTISNGLTLSAGNPSLRAYGRIVSQIGTASVCAHDPGYRATGLCQLGGTAYIANCDGNGYYMGDWWLQFDSDYQFTARRGIRYSYMYYASANAFGLGWNIWPGYISGTVDEAVYYPFVNGSDRRLKDNIRPSSLDCLSVIEQLPLVEYQWRNFPRTELKRDSSINTGKIVSYADPRRLKEAKAHLDSPVKRIGMIAQEVAKICPDVILEGDDFDDHLGRVWSIDYNNMLALCIGAIQQLRKEIVVLKKKNI